MEVGLFEGFDIPICEESAQPQFIDPNIITLSSTVKRDEYTDYIQEKFDLKVEDTCIVEVPNRIHLDALGDWNIGIICGASGSGKSTILKNLGGAKLQMQPLIVQRH